MAQINATPTSRPVLLVLALALVVLLCYGMRVAFEKPGTALKAEMLASAGAGTSFTLEDGARIPGTGNILVEDELVAVQRVTAEGSPVNSGILLLNNQHTFKVVERGAAGTKVTNHAAGASVKEPGTLFFPENFASFGDEVDELFYLILWITGIAFILTEGFFLFCVFSFWAKPGMRAHHLHGHHTLELVWTLVPAIILVALALLQAGMWKSMKMEIPLADSPDVFEVQVAAQQFQWNFRVAGSDGKFATPDDVPSVGELHVPVGKKVRVVQRSIDVIHCFFLPNYRVKQDVVPGLAVPVWFDTSRAGRFPIMCAELCGLGHTKMGGTLVVHETADFKTWLEKESTLWTSENDGQDRPDWSGASSKIWWWWDQHDVGVHYQGEKTNR
ncbi:MAG: cytochrome c oxidase subunit II [Planctomycetes bacterium]|nr:cytochrome c oxidase subunit II [Planctomycetota bacterium]